MIQTCGFAFALTMVGIACAQPGLGQIEVDFSLNGATHGKLVEDRVFLFKPSSKGVQENRIMLQPVLARAGIQYVVRMGESYIAVRDDAFVLVKKQLEATPWKQEMISESFVKLSPDYRGPKSGPGYGRFSPGERVPSWQQFALKLAAGEKQGLYLGDEILEGETGVRSHKLKLVEKRESAIIVSRKYAYPD